MSKAGGIIGIIAGVFGFIAAGVTLFFGGLGASFDTEGAKSVVGLGWGGVLFSFLAIVFGAVAIARPKVAGIGLIIVSILGAFLGGTLVAICMVLSLVGGILAVVGAKDVQPASGTVADEAAVIASKKKTSAWLWAGVGVAVVVIGLVMVGGQNAGKPKEDPLAELVNAQPSTLQAVGELSELFALGSKNTDLQRENKLKEIKGQIVEWQLPVYEVSRSGDGYKVQTKTGVRVGSFGQDLVGTFIYVTPRNDAERKAIEELKTGDPIFVKGRIAGSSLRMLELNPAILASQGSSQPQVQQTSQDATPTDANQGSSLASIEGNHPTQALENEALKSRIEMLLGESLKKFEDRLGTASPVKRQGDWLVGTGIKPHYGGSDGAAFAVNVNSGEVFAMMLVDGKQLLSFGVETVAELPPPLLAWCQEQGGQCQ